MDIGVMDKIAKLLAQAESTTHEAEADTAKRLAANLMAKHQIEAILSRDNNTFRKVLKHLERATHLKYDTMLHGALAEFCGVKYLTRKRNGTASHVYLGRTCDIAGLLYLIDIVTIQRESAWASFKLKRTTTRAMWLNGFAFGVQDKLYELKSMENTAVTEKGLVPVSLADQALAWYKENNKVTTTKGRSVSFNEHGREAGRNTQFRKGLDNSGQVGMKRLA